MQSDPHGDSSLSFFSFVFLPVDSRWYIIRTNGLLDDKAIGLVEKFLSVVSHDQTDRVYLTIFVNASGYKSSKKGNTGALAFLILMTKMIKFYKKKNFDGIENVLTLWSKWDAFELFLIILSGSNKQILFTQ